MPHARPSRTAALFIPRMVSFPFCPNPACISVLLSRKRLAPRLFAERQEEQSEQECDRRERDRRAKRPEGDDGVADEKRDARSDEPASGRDECKRAGAARR